LRSPDEVVEFYGKAAQVNPDVRIEVDHMLCDKEWAAFEVWALATGIRTEDSPRFAVFDRWNDGQLVYYRTYAGSR
jgi:hypothetical protein